MRILSRRFDVNYAISMPLSALLRTIVEVDSSTQDFTVGRFLDEASNLWTRYPLMKKYCLCSGN